MLPLEDKRLAKQFQSIFRKRGIQVLLKTKVESIAEYAADHVTAKLSEAARDHRREDPGLGRPQAQQRRHRPGDGRRGDRRPRLHRGERLPGDHGRRTSTPSATSTAASCWPTWPPTKALVAVDNCLGGDGGARPAVVPSCTYSAARGGQRGPERGAGRGRGLRAGHRHLPLARLGKAMAMGEESGYVQIVADKSTDRRAGRQHDGRRTSPTSSTRSPWPSRTGSPSRTMGDTIHAHPTIAEARHGGGARRARRVGARGGLNGPAEDGGAGLVRQRYELA